MVRHYFTPKVHCRNLLARAWRDQLDSCAGAEYDSSGDVANLFFLNLQIGFGAGCLHQIRKAPLSSSSMG